MFIVQRLRNVLQILIFTSWHCTWQVTCI